jgi:hypothetical protein
MEIFGRLLEMELRSNEMETSKSFQLSLNSIRGQLPSKSGCLILRQVFGDYEKNNYLHT